MQKRDDRMSGNPRIKKNVYALIKEKILFLELIPGEKIIETNLADEFQVSRTPIREALKRLEEEEFIDIYPQRGTYVSRIDMKHVKEMAYARHVLENDVILELCKNKVKVRSDMEEIILMMNLALNKGDFKTYIKRDNAFHRKLFECANHEQIWDAISGAISHYTRILVLDMMMPDNLQESYLSHLKIVDCIEQGNTKELCELLDNHHDHKITETDIIIMKKYPEYFIE